MKRIGFTTSIPVEIIYAANLIPVDLNNVFISTENPEKFIEEAEAKGFPRNTCGWIKGIYTAAACRKSVNRIIGVLEGDCSNTKAMLEVMETENIENIPFAYPLNRDYSDLRKEFIKLQEAFGVTNEEISKTKIKLDKIRKKLILLDELTWKENKASSFENHYWLVSSSDFASDYIGFDINLDKKIEEIAGRESIDNGIRLGYIGVPPIFLDFYDKVETLGGRVVFNEVQRQFSLPFSITTEDIIDVYLKYTYPYGIRERIIDIKNEISRRKLDGIIHYTQSFCFRGIEDIVLRKELDIPMLTLEGDRPGDIDARTTLRIETFIDMIRESKV